MFSVFKQLDELLRGKIASPQKLAEGQLELDLRTLVPAAAILGAAYGLFMGLYTLSNYWRGITAGEPERCWQILSSMVKLPAVLLLTLAITFPSMYVFNAMFGCRLSFTGSLRLLVGAVAVHTAVAASFGPILAFFTINTTHYSFMVVLNLFFLGIAGIVALGFLLYALKRIACCAGPPVSLLDVQDDGLQQHPDGVAQQEAGEPGHLGEPAAARPGFIPGQVRAIFWIWLLIYGAVGAQMGWLFRPFVGNPDMPFVWFRSFEGNFLEGAWVHIRALLFS